MRVCTQNHCESIVRLTRQMRAEMDALDKKSAGRDGARKPGKPNGLAHQDRTLTAGSGDSRREG